jgi:hypothetical protein
VAKATPAVPCNAENCGDNFSRCGAVGTYTRGCRCETCTVANREQVRRYRAANKERLAEKRRQYDAANREKLNAYHRDYVAANRDKIREYDRCWRNSNKEHVATRARKYRDREDKDAVRARKRAAYRSNPAAALERNKRWSSSNQDKMRAYARKNVQNRRALLLAAWVEDVDPMVVFERDEWKCQECGIRCEVDVPASAKNKAHLDHIIPLAWGVFWGGFHSYANTQLLCCSCNSSKGAHRK